MIFDDEPKNPSEENNQENTSATEGTPDSSENDEDFLAQEKPPADMAEALGAVYDVPVQVSAVLGTAQMRVSQLLRIGRGAVIELDRKVGEAVDIYVNNRLVARGEVVVVEDQLGITMTEIIKSDQNTRESSF